MKDQFTRNAVKAVRHKGTRIGTLWYSKDECTGDVTITSEFINMHPLERIDILHDIKYLIEHELDKAAEDLNKGLQSKTKKAKKKDLQPIEFETYRNVLPIVGNE